MNHPRRGMLEPSPICGSLLEGAVSEWAIDSLETRNQKKNEKRVVS